jgi:hypothetical protein
MNDAGLSRIVEQLWAARGEHVYALLDGARDPAVHRAVLGSGEPTACLYAGKLSTEIASVAPYLVRLSREGRLVRDVLGAGWGRSWGVLLSSEVDLERLRRHFRRMLRVQTERGETLLFRFYDPRVLRVYLATCTAAELEAFFGPVASFFVEPEAGEAIDVYARAGGEVSLTRVPLAAS